MLLERPPGRIPTSTTLFLVTALCSASCTGTAAAMLRHNPQEFNGNGLCREQGFNEQRYITGGGDGDTGLSDSDYAAAEKRGIDVARKAAGVEHLLPTALLSCHVGGSFRQEVVATQAAVPPFLEARTSQPLDHLRH